MNISDLLHIMLDKKASDLHLKEGRPPLLRIDGKLSPLDMATITEDDLKEMIFVVADERQRKKFEETSEMDSAYNLEDVARFRANVFKQKGKIEIVLRAIPIQIPSLEELNLPSVLSEISLYPRGLVLVTGTTGSGKSTTLAAMINKVNENYNHHIVTIEDPIEFVHSDKKCSVSQREVGLDTETFASALKYVLRQDPDVILIGEMRDSETVKAAISAAETGHMVFSTLHTIDTVQTINRILDFFAKEEQHQMRIQMAGALRAVLSLRLVLRADGVGRVPGVEIMIVTPTVRALLEEGKISQIKDMIKDGAQYGMQTFDQSLISLYKKGLISIEEARRNATSQQEIDLSLKGISSSKASAQSILDSMLKDQVHKELEEQIRQAKALFAANKMREAYAAFEKILSQDPTNKEIADLMEKVKVTVNKEQNQQLIKSMINDGLNIYKQGNIKGAILKWQEVLNMDPDNMQAKSYIKSAEERQETANAVPQIIAEGVELYKTGKVEEAINTWKKVLKMDLTNAQAKAYIESAEQKLKEFRLKKEIEKLHKKGVEEAEAGNLLQAIFSLKKALNLKPDSQEIQKNFDDTYNRLISDSISADKSVDSEVAVESFKKGLDEFLKENYVDTIKEWKKTQEKRPLDKKLKDYIDRAKDIFKARLEELIEKMDEAYRTKNVVEMTNYSNAILKLDPTNEYTLKFLRDVRPMIEEEAQNKYKEAMDLYNDNKLKEAREKIISALQMAPDHVTAKKRLEEINERLAKVQDVK